MPLPSTSYMQSVYEVDADVDDFTFCVDLGAEAPQSFWDACTSSDGTKMRVADHHTEDERPFDPIDFDNTGEDGVLRFKHAGTASSLGTYMVRVYPAVTGNTSYGVSDTYGQYNAYDSSWVGYWPDGGGTDRTSNGNDGTADSAGNPTIGGGTGKVGAATDYDGSDDGVSVGNLTALNGIAGLTWMGWINPGTASASLDHVFGVFDDDSDGIVFLLYGSPTTWGLLYGGWGGSDYLTTASSWVPEGSWTHIAGTFDGTAAAAERLLPYTGGVERAKTRAGGNGQTTTPTTTDPATFGYRPTAHDRHFDGLLNEIQAHTTARSADWISLEHDQTNGGFWNFGYRVVKSIGATGRDYATITLWEADLDSATHYQSGDIAVGECYDDADFNEYVTINGGATIGLAGIVLTAAESARHDGTPNSGVRIKPLSASGTVVALNTSLEGIWFEVSWLEIHMREVSSNMHGIGGMLGGDRAGFFIHHNIIHIDTGGSVSSNKTGCRFQYFDDFLYVYSNVIYNITTQATGGADAIGINCLAGSITNKKIQIIGNTLFNITNTLGSGDAYGIKFAATNANTVVKNNLVLGTGDSTATGTIRDYSSNVSSATTAANGSQDTTSPDGASYQSWDPADNFTDTTVSAPDLSLKSGADAIDAGSDLGDTYGAVDITGRDRHAEGDTWDCGAYEYVSAGTYAELAGTPEITIDLTADADGLADLAATPAITITLVGDLDIGATYAELAGTPQITVGLTGDADLLADLAGTPQITVSATALLDALAELAADPQIAIDLQATLDGLADLAGSPLITIDLAGDMTVFGYADLAGNPHITISLTGNLFTQILAYLLEKDVYREKVHPADVYDQRIHVEDGYSGRFFPKDWYEAPEEFTSS